MHKLLPELLRLGEGVIQVPSRFLVRTMYFGGSTPGCAQNLNREPYAVLGIKFKLAVYQANALLTYSTIAHAPEMTFVTCWPPPISPDFCQSLMFPGIRSFLGPLFVDLSLFPTDQSLI